MTVIGITSTANMGNAAVVKAFIEQMGVTFPVVWDTPHSYDEWGAGLGVSAYPLDIVVDRTGKVTYLARQYEADELRAAVEAAL